MITGATGPPPLTLDRLEAMSPDERAVAARGRPDFADALAPLVHEVRALVLVDLRRSDALSDLLVGLAAESGRAPLLAAARAARAHVLASANRYEEALEVSDAAVRDAEGAGLRAEAATAHLTSVQPLSRMGRLREALAAAARARSLFESIGDATGAARASVNAGIILRQLDDPEEALRRFTQARGAFAGAALILAQIDSNAAEALLELNRFAEADAAFASALAQFVAAGNRRAGAIVEGNRADLLARQGRLDEALARFESAIRAFEAEGSPGDLARLRTERAEVYAAVGLHAEAEADLAMAIPELRARAMAPELGRALLARAEAGLAAGRVEAAEEFAREAAEGFARIGHATGAARVGLLRARLLASEGRRPEAIALAREALERVSDRPAERARAGTALGLLLVDDGRPDEAAAVLDDAVAHAGAWGGTPLLAEALHARGRRHLTAGDTRAGLADLRAAMDAIERIRGRLPGEGFRVAFAGGRAGVYEDAVGALMAAGASRSVADAFAVVERARCRALADMIRGALGPGAERPGGGAAPLLAEHGAAKAELNALYSVLSDPDPARQARAGRGDWRARVEACEQRLATLEARLASTDEFRDVFAPAADAAAVARVLPPGTLFVEYAQANGRLLGFVIGADGLRGGRDLGGVDDAGDRVSRMGLQIGRALARGIPAPGDPGGAALRRDAAGAFGALHGVLVAPLEDLLEGAARLIIAPAGPLHKVPFEALHDGDRFLVERWAVSYAPSGSVLRELWAGRAGARKAEGHALVVGAPDADAPWIEAEARAVAALVPRARLLLGPDATVDRFCAEARGAALIHLACHAVAPDASPMSGRMRFSDRWMTARDVAGLNLGGSTVVVSACETGRGADLGSEEAYGLVRAMLVAGARSVIATRWPVHDRSTAEVMSATYEALARGATEGLSVPEALRGVQTAAITQGRHPAAWAPFLVMGGSL